MNVCFSSDKSGLKNTTLSNLHGFYEIFSPPPKYVDILVINGDGDVSDYADCNIDACIFDSNYASRVLELKNVNSAISCGMQGLDSVTFSSISEDSALVCIRRSLIFNKRTIDPCEFKTHFDSRLGIFQNLVISMIDFLSNRKGE